MGCTSETRPRTTSTDTKTFGAYVPFSATLTTGALPDSGCTKESITPSRSTVTSAVACRKGMRTWNWAVCPDS